MWTAAFLLFLSSAAAAATPALASGHVRCDNSRVAAILELAATRSAAFRQDLDIIERSNTIVHVAEGRCENGVRFGCTMLISAAGERHVLVRLNAYQSQRTVLTQLAHELHHASEIAAAPDVVDAASLVRLYEKIGYLSCYHSRLCWETRAAQTAERAVVQQALSYKPPVDEAFFGEWTLDVPASSFRAVDAPREGHRFHRSQSYGLISVVSDTVAADGVAHRDTYVYRPDGRSYRVSDDDGEPLVIAVTALGKLTATFTLERGGVVVGTGRMTLDPHKTTLTIETSATDDAGGIHADIEIWRKVRNSTTTASKGSA